MFVGSSSISSIARSSTWSANETRPILSARSRIVCLSGVCSVGGVEVVVLMAVLVEAAVRDVQWEVYATIAKEEG